MQKQPEKIIQSAGTFQSDSTGISFERYEPDKPEKLPAVLVLHGTDGFKVFGKALYQHFARTLARNGYRAFLIRYFDRTGTAVGNPKINREHFATWLATLADALSFVAGQPTVDPQRIGLFGISLGASLALSLATQDQRIAAVVDYFGALPDSFVPLVKQMPPVLILHGAADTVVSVNEAYKIETVFQERNLLYEITIYPNQGHGFLGSDGQDALQRALIFFDKHLKGTVHAISSDT